MLQGHNAYKHYLELSKKKCRCDLLDDSSTSSGPILPHIIQWQVYIITNPVNRAAPKGHQRFNKARTVATSQFSGLIILTQGKTFSVN